VEFDEKMAEDNDEREFERKLRLALRHREAPLGLRQRVLAIARERRLARRGRIWIWQRIAASALLAATLGGFAVYRQVEERRRGEEARDQVLTALRITSRTLDRVHERLAESSR
jgi:hypothetical protein